MADITTIKDYFKKLRKIINFEAVFNFGSYKLVKKSRINDISCCILATLPDNYKRVIKTKKDIQRYKSVLSYNVLSKILAKRFLLDKNLCIINVTEANKMIDTIIASIERDINAIEEFFNKD